MTGPQLIALESLAFLIWLIGLAIAWRDYRRDHRERCRRILRGKRHDS
jgi:hypothetical protein